jgi:anti-sigma B factor antagonist
MDENLTILALHGSLTLHNGNQSLEAIKHQIKAPTNIVLIDMGQVDFVDSAGLATLIKLSKFFMECGIRLSLCCIPPQLAQILHLTSTEDLFEIFDSREKFYQSWIEEFPTDASLKPLELMSVVEIKAE